MDEQQTTAPDAPEVPQIAPSEQNGDFASESGDENLHTAEADPADNEAELTDEQKNEQALKDREERSRRSARGIQKRFQEMTAAQQRAEARADAAERRNDMILQRLLQGGGQPQPGMPQPQGTGEPQRTDPQFAGDYEAYLDARADWRAEQRVVASMTEREQQWAAQQSQQAVNHQAAQIAQEFTTRMEKSVKGVPNFSEIADDILNGSGDVEIGHGAMAIVESDDPAKVIAYLAQNREAAQRIARMSPIGAARAIGQLELTLKGKPQISNAPAPINPVGARASASSSPPEDPDAYMAWAAKHMR